METILSPERRLYTPTEVMAMFQISRPTFGAWCKQGVLRKIEIPGRRRVYIDASSVDKLLSSK